MKKPRILNLFILFFLLVSLLLFPTQESQASYPSQSADLITATGQFCEHNICGSFSFEFNPEGGSVSGSFSGTRTTDQYGILHVSGNLTGTFAGGDGGLISGSISNAQWWWTSKATGNVVDSPVDFSAVNLDNWYGTLFASGNGNGTIGESGTWSVTYVPDGFQVATEESATATDENPTVETTPTSNAVVGKEFTLLPETKAFIASSPTLSDATQAIFAQDAAIIVRDQNNQFYAIGNDGNSVALPSALNSYFKMSNQFAVLGNDEWLASSEHGSIRGTINGGGDFVLMNKIPTELKEHDYTMLATNCSNTTECTPQMRINSTASSTQVFGTCLLSSSTSSATGMNQGDINYVSSPGDRTRSSEHGSCRGTINGGGDFIFQPPKVIMASSMQPNQNSTNPGYLGVLVENKSDGAEIFQVQTGSPADAAGLEIGDLITNISGTPLDEQHTLSSTLSQFSGGEEVILGIVRNGQTTAINLTLASLHSPEILTPSAIITITENTELIVDIGFNGVTGVLVLADTAHVVEPITNTQVEVQTGQAVIVVPGEPLDTVFWMPDSEINAWWEGEPAGENATPPQIEPAEETNVQNIIGHQDFNPLPGADEESVYIIITLVLGVLYLVVWLILLIKK